MVKEKQEISEERIKKALVELEEIFKKVVPKDKLEAIPNGFISFMKENKDNNYEFIYDTSKNLDEQELMQETKILFGMVYMDYWASSEEKKELNQKLDENEKKYLEEVNNKYSIEEIFKKKEQENTKKKEEQDKLQSVENLPIEYSESIFRKIVKFFKRLFGRK